MRPFIFHHTDVALILTVVATVNVAALTGMGAMSICGTRQERLETHLGYAVTGAHEHEKVW